MNIEFDPVKNKINLRKHGISLADVDAVFYDPCAITIEDRDHKEQRFVTMGMDSLADSSWFAMPTGARPRSG